MREVVCARFERFADKRTVSLVEADDGILELRELVCGPSALAAYGEREHSLRVLFAAPAASRLLGAVGEAAGGTLAAYLSNEKNDLVDLIDLCDEADVPCAYMGMGPASGVVVREGEICASGRLLIK